MTYTGWLLPEADRAKLLQMFPPTYHRVVAHHVTLSMGTVDLPTATTGTIIGQVDDGLGVQALIVVIDGTTERWDGFTYHITWSIDQDTHNRKTHHSLTVLQDADWELGEPVKINLVPMVFID